MNRAGIQAAWELVMRWPWPLPGDADRDVTLPQAARYLPVMGLLLGVAGLLVFLLLALVVGSWVALSASASLLLVFGNWWLTRARAINGFLQVASGWPARGGVDSGTMTVWQLNAGQGLILLKLLGVGVLLASGNAVWYIAAPVIAWTVYGEIALAGETRDEASGSGPVHWYIAAGIVLVVAIFVGMLIPGLLALLLGWLGAGPMRRWFARAGQADADKAALATVECIEVLVLWIGVLAL